MDGLIAPRLPCINGTHTTNTRSAGSGFLLKTLFCTQLAPARHVIQVGEKISTSRGRPSARLNSDLRVEMAFSAMTPPGREVAAGPAAAAGVPGAGVPGAGVPGAGVPGAEVAGGVDTGGEEHA